MNMNDKWNEYWANRFLPKENLNEKEKQMLESIKEITNGGSYFINENGGLVCYFLESIDKK